MTLRKRDGTFAKTADVRGERNKYFHRALITAIAALKRAGFEGESADVTYNERMIELTDPLDADTIMDFAAKVETARLYPDVIYNVSFQDTRGRWFAASRAWETVELAMLDVIERIAEMMQRYQRAGDGGEDEDEYAVSAIMVSVYNFRK